MHIAHANQDTVSIECLYLLSLCLSKWLQCTLCAALLFDQEQECSGLTTKAIKVRSTRDLAHKSWPIIVDLSDRIVITDAKTPAKPEDGHEDTVRSANDKEGNNYL